MTLLIGAGAFSHAHIRTLNELGITNLELLKNTAWTDEQQDLFIQKYPNNNFLFSNELDSTGKIVHVITPSNTHLAMLNQLSSANKIFVEKPSVLYNCEQDFVTANSLQNIIYHNDWFANIQNLRHVKIKPKQINIKYDVRDKPIDLITEVISHGINLLSLWCEPSAEIEIKYFYSRQDEVLVHCDIDNIDFKMIATADKTDKSNWQCTFATKDQVEQFVSQRVGGQLLINTLNTMLTNSIPLTNWYKCSWLIHKFRMLLTPDVFYKNYKKYYKCK